MRNGSSSLFLLPRPQQSTSSSPFFFLSLSFDRLTRNTGLLTLEDLSALPELQGNPYVPMVYAFLCREAGKKTAAKEKGGGLGAVEFGRALESLDGGGGGGGGGAGGAATGGGDGLAAAVFRVLDSDGDGKLSLDELEGALRPLLLGSAPAKKKKEEEAGGIPPALVAGAALQKHDGDGDGGLSLPEFRSLLAAGGGGK